jgi:hypothetical protein
MKSWIACLIVSLVVLPAWGQAPQAEADPTKVKPEQPLAGKLLGSDFKLDSVKLHVNTGALVLTGGKDTLFIFLNDKPGQAVEGKSYVVGPGDQGMRVSIHVHVHSVTPAVATAYTTGCTMRLEFGKEKEGKVPAKLELRLPDEKQSSITGSFTVPLR